VPCLSTATPIIMQQFHCRTKQRNVVHSYTPMPRTSVWMDIEKRGPSREKLHHYKIRNCEFYLANRKFPKLGLTTGINKPCRQCVTKSFLTIHRKDKQGYCCFSLSCVYNSNSRVREGFFRTLNSQSIHSQFTVTNFPYNHIKQLLACHRRVHGQDYYSNGVTSTLARQPCTCNMNSSCGCR
jgi:hypothetical protein